MIAEAVALTIALAISVAITRWVLVLTDEAWFLQVVRRVRDGERLYEDVFFGAGPLAVWLASLAVRWSRPQITFIRALIIGYGFAIWFAGIALLRVAGLDRIYSVVFVLGALALGGHHLARGNQYGLLSQLGVIIAAFGVVQGDGLVTGTGIALALTGKYSLGVFATLWALPLLAIEAGLAAAAWAALVIAAAAVAIGLILGTRGVRSFVAVAVANKGTYLATAGIGPVQDLLNRARQTGRTPLYRAITLVGPIAVFTVFALGAAAAAFGLTAGVLEGSSLLVLASAICATGLAVAFPRADHAHQVAAMPLVLLGMLPIVAWITPPTAVLAGVAVVLGGVLAATLAASVLVVRSAMVRRDLPRLRLLPVMMQGLVWPDDTESVVRTAGNEVFVLRPDAPYFYLSGRLENPTPYDYPLVVTFGPHGQATIAAAINTGGLRWVCYPGPSGGRLAPTQLERKMDQRAPIEQTSIGGLYDSETDLTEAAVHRDSRPSR